MKTAKIFKHGNSQAVRLPKEFRFAGDEVQIKRSGASVLLLPGKRTYEQIMAVIGRFNGPIERRQSQEQVSQSPALTRLRPVPDGARGVSARAGCAACAGLLAS
ncbi:virulence-associated protein, partial [mine drainage metagenome]